MLESVAANLLIDAHWASNRIPVDPFEIAAAAGIALRPFAEQTSASGWFRIEDGAPVIYFNADESRRRQRFTVAHEIGHYALSHGERDRDTASSFATNVWDPVEVSANRFAAELLMPAKAVQSVVIDRGVASLSDLARIFDVSEVAMRYRLNNLGYVS